MYSIAYAFVMLTFPVSAQQDFATQGKPGPEHERLKGLVGKWDLTTEGSPGKGTAEYKSILGGRFIIEEVKIPFGDLSFEWLGIYGYDKQKKKYTATWVDNMDTTTETGEGDADGKMITYKGQHIDPRTNKPGKFTWRIGLDGEKLVVEMLENDAAGKEQKMLTLSGVKAK